MRSSPSLPRGHDKLEARSRSYNRRELPATLLMRAQGSCILGARTAIHAAVDCTVRRACQTPCQKSDAHRQCTVIHLHSGIKQLGHHHNKRHNLRRSHLWYKNVECGPRHMPVAYGPWHILISHCGCQRSGYRDKAPFWHSLIITGDA